MDCSAEDCWLVLERFRFDCLLVLQQLILLSAR
jgi:hypothetical protein